ncbi:5'/3'-nucleotidase SurE, partial [archaeon]|nr:5'/3'-nucleotidase SurE [archaeon]
SPVSISKGDISGVPAYSINGTPVDAVIAGVYGILEKPPDLIISGINVGENMSSEITTSGTVGAALEGASQGIPSIAISLHSTEAIKFVEMNYKVDFKAAQNVLKKLAKHVLKNGLPEGVDLLNVNAPTEVKDNEIEITRLARRMYTTSVEERHDPRGRKYYWIAGDPIKDAEVGTDVHTVRVHRRISITPLKLDFTCVESLQDLEVLKNL